MAPVLAGAIALSGCVSPEPGSTPPSSAAPALPPQGVAWKEFEAGHWDASRSGFQQVVDSRPNDPAGHFGLGRVALAEGKRQQAVEHFQRATTLDQSSAASWAFLGTAQLQLEQNADAFISLQKALRLDPKQGQALVAMAEYAATVEVDYGKALRHLEQAKASGYTAIPADLESSIRQRLN